MLWRPTESVCLRVLLGSFIGADATGVMTATGATIGLMQVLRRSFTDASTDGADVQMLRWSFNFGFLAR